MIMGASYGYCSVWMRLAHPARGIIIVWLSVAQKFEGDLICLKLKCYLFLSDESRNESFSRGFLMMSLLVKH